MVFTTLKNNGSLLKLMVEPLTWNVLNAQNVPYGGKVSFWFFLKNISHYTLKNKGIGVTAKMP